MTDNKEDDFLLWKIERLKYWRKIQYYENNSYTCHKSINQNLNLCGLIFLDEVKSGVIIFETSNIIILKLLFD